ncbi:unnamed protein product [Soboliphyme baturini]|uniref:TRP domain-containing protein n=1 Tax=Soboliphyme baturini TaxID=241478 RepID=A0A183J0B4_9BILA|nr:unnamed protein product [Soboliphyme baturini]
MAQGMALTITYRVLLLVAICGLASAQFRKAVYYYAKRRIEEMQNEAVKRDKFTYWHLTTDQPTNEVALKAKEYVAWHKLVLYYIFTYWFLFPIGAIIILCFLLLHYLYIITEELQRKTPSEKVSDAAAALPQQAGSAEAVADKEDQTVEISSTTSSAPEESAESVDHRASTTSSNTT